MKGAVCLYFGDTLLTNGSYADLQKLGLSPVEGLELTFYDEDSDDNDKPLYLCGKGKLHQDDAGFWHAIVDESTFHHVPR